MVTLFSLETAVSEIVKDTAVQLSYNWQWLSRQEVSLGTQLLQFIFVSQIVLEC